MWEDGRPAAELAGATVELRAVESSATRVSPHGEIAADGTFVLLTGQEPGAPPGKYRAMIMPKQFVDDEKRPPPPIMAARFANYDESGLEVGVEPQPENHIKLTIQRFRNP